MTMNKSCQCKYCFSLSSLTTTEQAQIAIVESARLQCYRDLLRIDVPFAETELPENIRDFRAIAISYLDTKVLKFMRRLQPLFRDIILKLDDFEFSLETAQAALDHCMPLFTGGIDTIRTDHPQLVFFIRDRFPTQFLAIKKLHLWTNDTPFNKFIKHILPWLHTNREDGEPRMLLLTMIHLRDNNYAWNVERIRKQFLNATRPVSFCICLLVKLDDGIPFRGVEQESITQNARTGEQLVVRQQQLGVGVRGRKRMSIGRCSSELDGLNWIEEMYETMEQKRVIWISYPTIGPIEEANPEEGEQNEEVDVDQQPGPSTKRRK